jgi:ABC-type nitrate/sulfonate/bicarbonate transport system substrate-binding protein
MSALDSPAEQDMRRLQILPWLAAVAMAAFLPASILAQDTLKLAVGAPGNRDTCIPEIGQRAGIFRKHGLTLELLYTQGGGETMQAVISGSVHIGITYKVLASPFTDAELATLIQIPPSAPEPR